MWYFCFYIAVLTKDSRLQHVITPYLTHGAVKKPTSPVRKVWKCLHLIRAVTRASSYTVRRMWTTHNNQWMHGATLRNTTVMLRAQQADHFLDHRQTVLAQLVNKLISHGHSPLSWYHLMMANTKMTEVGMVRSQCSCIRMPLQLAKGFDKFLIAFWHLSCAIRCLFCVLTSFSSLLPRLAWKLHHEKFLQVIKHLSTPLMDFLG